MAKSIEKHKFDKEEIFKKWKSFEDDNINLNFHGVYFIAYSKDGSKNELLKKIIYIGVSTYSKNGIQQRLNTFRQRTYASKIDRVRKYAKEYQIKLPKHFKDAKSNFFYTSYTIAQKKKGLTQIEKENLFCLELDGFFRYSKVCNGKYPIFNVVRQKTQKK
jgi:hypothetical protein